MARPRKDTSESAQTPKKRKTKDQYFKKGQPNPDAKKE